MFNKDVAQQLVIAKYPEYNPNIGHTKIRAKNYRENNKERIKTLQKKWRVKHGKLPRVILSTEEKQLRKKARHIVFIELRAGRVNKKQCEICGKKAEAHHEDYSQPLNVTWLCREHHLQKHKKIS